MAASAGSGSSSGSDSCANAAPELNIRTAAKPIVFTSGEATPAAGDWVGIWLNTATGSRLDFVEISYAGDPLDIGFNVTYMIDVLNNVDSENVVFSFADANSSCLVTVPGNDSYRYVVMPMRI